ncbi:hypothetical protein RHECNPAF_280084 [Rhizobium etli CNPAF512]|nr:hypothetical protein RHECNPAF_280084 [Rhizobium etli CNPAF512]
MRLSSANLLALREYCRKPPSHFKPLQILYLQITALPGNAKRPA